MAKRVYISADYDESEGDREVVEVLNKWGQDDLHKVDFIDMSEVKSGTVANDPDCRICDLKAEFNKQINASSFVIFVVGDKTASRTAGCMCFRAGREQKDCECTPYKGNANGAKPCKVGSTSAPNADECGYINSYSYLKHEFEHTIKKSKNFIILYNSTRKESSWLPSYMNGYEGQAIPFWVKNDSGERVGDYESIKGILGF